MSTPSQGHRLRLGELVLHNGLASSGRIEHGLAVQSRVRRMGLPLELGEILVRSHDLEATVRDALLQLQARIDERRLPVESGEKPEEPGKPARPSQRSRKCRIARWPAPRCRSVGSPLMRARQA